MVMSYEIRKPSGKARGVVNLPVRVGAIVKTNESKSSSDAPVMAYPAAGYSAGQRNKQYYPPQYHAQYGQPAVYYQQPAYVRPQRRRGGPGMGLGAGLLGIGFCSGRRRWVWRRLWRRVRWLSL
ncbi:hypothetical protein KC19_VG152800 [Ceratodon purpureus]|uniref:Uncharacterized protein n=1 Tax=Ceratodon purpureus TaxID=3225 RepID=A0A8T0HQS5_CERPU|nr:hypothetical protein KC19_VG152800 [Ceratodon purpureus]